MQKLVFLYVKTAKNPSVSSYQICLWVPCHKTVHYILNIWIRTICMEIYVHSKYMPPLNFVTMDGGKISLKIFHSSTSTYSSIEAEVSCENELMFHSYYSSVSFVKTLHFSALSHRLCCRFYLFCTLNAFTRKIFMLFKPKYISEIKFDYTL